MSNTKKPDYLLKKMRSITLSDDEVRKIRFLTGEESLTLSIRKMYEMLNKIFSVGQ